MITINRVFRQILRGVAPTALRSAILLGSGLTAWASNACASWSGEDLARAAAAHDRSAAGTGDERDSARATAFHGYVQGVADALSGTTLCIPADREIMLDFIVSKWVAEHRELWSNTGANLVTLALMADFSCYRRQ